MNNNTNVHTSTAADWTFGLQRLIYILSWVLGPKLLFGFRNTEFPV